MVKARTTAVFLLALGGDAAAHPEMSPLLTNRYLTATAFPDRLEISYALLSGPLPGAEERKRIDLDRDGRLEETELAAEGASLAGRSDLLSVSLDDKPVTVTFNGHVDLGGDASTGAVALVREIRAVLPVAAGRHTLRLEPGTDPPRLGETEVILEPGPGMRLEASFSGRAPGDAPPAGTGAPRPPQTSFKTIGPRGSVIEDRSVTFTFGPLGPSGDGARRSSGRVGVFLGVAVILVVVWLRVRLHRRRAR